MSARSVVDALRDERVCRLELASTPSAVGWARRHTGEVLTAWGFSELTDTATLLVSELVTNAIRHGIPNGAPVGERDPAGGEVPAGGGEAASCPGVGYPELGGVYRVVLVLRSAEDEVVVEVFDPDPTPPVLMEQGAEVAESGRGLFLVASLSHRWSYYLSPGGGKVVWAALATTAPAATSGTSGTSGDGLMGI